MQLIFLLFLTFTLNLFAGELVNEILVDEFTDEKTIALTFLADDDHEIYRRWGQISCNDGYLVFGIEDSEVYHGEEYINAKFRFDKNQTFERSLDFDVNSSIASSYSEEIIFKFLDELNGSEGFIVKLESSETSMKFSNLLDSEKKVIEFITRITSQTDC